MNNEEINLFDFNPLKTPFREHQEDTISTLIDFVQNPDKQYFLCQAPTGAGKSLIAMTLSNYVKEKLHKDVFITSSKNILLDQYAQDYDKYISIIKGKSNYPCLLMNNCTYEDAPCHLNLIKNENNKEEDKSKKKTVCPMLNKCPYRLALTKALNDRIVFTNLHFLLLEMDYAKRFGKRDLLIIDEAHSIESILIDYRTVSYTESCIDRIQHILDTFRISTFKFYQNADKIYNGSYKVIPASTLKSINTDNLKEVDELLTKIKIFVRKILRAMTDGIEDIDVEKLSKEESKEFNKGYKAYLKDKTFLEHLVCKIENYEDNKTENEWICLPYYTKKTKEHTGFELKPIDATGLARNILHKIADKIIFMSATIGNKEMFCKNIGIDSIKTDYLSIESNFPVDKRPIYPLYAGAYSKNTKDEYLRNSIQVIDKIIESYKNYKGIIHTSNYLDVQYICQHSKYKSRLLYHESKNRDIVINQFKNSSDGILISPSCFEGLDLKDDLARWQIIFKIPWGNLGDKLVSRRKDKDSDWYVNNTAILFCQAYGRIVRSKDDWGDTFVLDSTFERLKNSGFLTTYVMEAIRKSP